MQTATPRDQPWLRERLLQRLRPFAAERGQEGLRPGLRPLGPQLFSYCAIKAERITQVRLEHPSLGVVLSGSKEVWLGELGRRLLPGEVFVFPGGVGMDVVNIPDERRGLYESLLMSVPSVPAALRAASPRAGASRAGADIGVPLTADLVEALGHAAMALADTGRAQALAEHRLTEVLMLLEEAPAARFLFASTLADRVRWKVLEAPSHAWTAAEIAAGLGIGASTLRRRLAGGGQSLRRIIAEARMQVAHELLSQGRANVTQAAQAAGYASRSHFARRYRRAHGQAPSQGRAGA